MKMNSLVDAVRDVPEKPSPEEMRVDSAHRAHREVIEGWVRGDVSDEKMKRSKARLNTIVKGRRQCPDEG
jgi:hypothetical protein